MRISDWSSDVCSSDLVGVLLDRARFTKVGKLRTFVLAAFDRTAELRQRHHRHMKFLRQRLQTTRNFRTFLHAVVAALRRTLEQLAIVDDDEADPVTTLPTPRADAQSGARKARRATGRAGGG